MFVSINRDKFCQRNKSNLPHFLTLFKSPLIWLFDQQDKNYKRFKKIYSWCPVSTAISLTEPKVFLAIILVTNALVTWLLQYSFDTMFKFKNIFKLPSLSWGRILPSPEQLLCLYQDFFFLGEGHRFLLFRLFINS